MAVKEKILEVLATQTEPIKLKRLGELLGEPIGNFQTQVDRMVENSPPLILRNENKEITITEEGRAYLLDSQAEDQHILEAQQITKETEGKLLTNKEMFISLGLDAGMTNKGFLKGAANLIWAKGDPENLDLVWEGLSESNLDKEVTKRWFSFWAAHIKKQVPQAIAQQIGPKKEEAKDRKTVVGARAWILDEREDPQYVGEGLGNLDYQDAVDISKLRAAAKVRAGAGAAPLPASLGTQAEDFVKVLNAIKTMQGGGQPPPSKSYIIRTDADGNLAKDEQGNPIMVELDTSKPTILATGGAKPQNPPTSPVSQLQDALDLAAKVRDIFGYGNKPDGQPKYIILNADGSTQEWKPGDAIPVRTTPAPAAASVIQFKDAQGNLGTLDLSTYFTLEEHKAKMARDKESHDMRIDIGKQAKDFLAKGAKVLEHRMGGRSEEKKEGELGS